MKKLKVVGMAFLISLALVFVLIAFQLSHSNKLAEESFRSLEESSCNKILNKNISLYIDDGTNKDKLDDFCGRTLTDEERSEQLSLALSSLSDGVNNSNIPSPFGESILADGAFMYFDADKNPINVSDTLVLARVFSDDEGKIKYYYTYKDDTLTENIHAVMDSYGEDYIYVNFYIDGAYIKGNEFIPTNVLYSYSGSEDINELYVTEKTDDEMKAAGYTYVKVESQFSLGSISSESSTDYVCAYILGVSDTSKTAVMGYMEKNKSKIDNVDGSYIFQKSKDGLFNTEYCSINKYVSADGQDSYYAVAYSKQNVFINMLRPGVLSNHPLWDFVKYPLEIIIAIVAAIVGSIIYIKKNNI